MAVVVSFSAEFALALLVTNLLLSEFLLGWFEVDLDVSQPFLGLLKLRSQCFTADIGLHLPLLKVPELAIEVLVPVDEVVSLLEWEFIKLNEFGDS